MTLNSKVFTKELRKKLAAFYTKPAVSVLLNTLVIDSGDSIIIDPACGSGTLLKSAYDRISDLMKNSNFKSYLIGIEIHEESWKESKKLENLSEGGIMIDISHGDAFLLYTILQGKITNFLNDLDRKDEKQKVIIVANPPFSKFQNISLQYKKLINSILHLEGNESLSLHSYFLKLILDILPENGKFGLILPITTSYSNRGKDLVKNFFSCVSLEKIILSEAETAFSIDSNFQEMIIIGYKNELKKKFSTTENIVTVFTLKKTITFENVNCLIKVIETSLTEEQNDFFSMQKISQQVLINKLGKEGWNFLYRSKMLNKLITNLEKNLIEIGLEHKIDLKRGLNKPTDYFFIPNKYFEIFSETKTQLKLNMRENLKKDFDINFHRITLPKSILIPIIRKPEYYKQTPIIGEEVIGQNYCFCLSNIENADSDVKKYVEFGSLISVNKRSNTRLKKDNWIFVDAQNYKTGKFFLTFKWDPRYRPFLVNLKEGNIVIASQAFWMIKIQNITSETEHFFLAWMNSTINMVIIYGLADVQRRVWRQLAGSRIKSLRVINFNYYSKLNEREKSLIKDFNKRNFNQSLLIEVQDALAEIELNKEITNLRAKVDVLFLKLILNQDDEELFRLVKELYIEFCIELNKITYI